MLGILSDEREPTETSIRGFNSISEALKFADEVN